MGDIMAPAEQTTGPTLTELLKGRALAGEWTLDPGRSTVALKSRSMWGLVRVNGVFRQVAGAGTVSATGEVRGGITVAAASIDTKNTKRDTHLRSADLLDTGNYPDIRFTVESITPSPGQHLAVTVTVTGTLNIRDRARSLTFDAAAAVHGHGSGSHGDVWLDAQVSINRGDFGMDWNVAGLAAMNNTLTIHAVFTSQ
jgi:polyisoprenoid-binding protein YceI